METVFDTELATLVDVLIVSDDAAVAPFGPPTFAISDVLFPGDIAVSASAAESVSATSPSKADAEWFLNLLYRKATFWEGQWEAVDRALRGCDSVVLLPTGRGKTIAFQLAALLRAGRCIVVSPLVALIEDQIDNLGRVGIDRAIGITSQIGDRTRRQQLEGVLAEGHYLFSYIAPERLQIQEFRHKLRELTTTTPVSLVAIDEAHCVSEWGHDFRTAYLNLGRVTRDYCASQDIVPPIMALTGTASKIVLKDVQRELAITEFEAIITPTSFDRANLHYTILRCLSHEKRDRIKGFLSSLPTELGAGHNRFFASAGSKTNAGLIFCPHVNGEYGVTDLAQEITSALGVPVEYYSGTAPRTKPLGNWNAIKQETMKRFKSDKVSVLACTKAFGMGIDKPNIRYTVHVGLPNSIEAFYQEAGRAGRDGQHAACAVVVSNDNRTFNERLLRPSTPLQQLLSAARDTKWADSDDITRALWFHANAFRGVEAEVAETLHVVEMLGDVARAGVVTVVSRTLKSDRVEKGLHRLVVIGAVADYTVEYGASERASNRFTVRLSGAARDDLIDAYRRYVASYQPRLGDEEATKARSLDAETHSDFVMGVARLLIVFVYEHVEQARRRSLSEVLQALDQSKNDNELRTRILDYLQHTEFDERLDAVRTSDLGGLDALDPLIEELVTPNDAAALRGTVGRLLGSYPDIPGLLLIRSLTEALSRDSDPEVVRQNLEAAIEFAAVKYRIPTETIGLACGLAIAKISGANGVSTDMLRTCASSAYADRQFIRGVIRAVPPGLSHLPKSWLVRQAVVRSAGLLERSG